MLFCCGLIRHLIDCITFNTTKYLHFCRFTGVQEWQIVLHPVCYKYSSDWVHLWCKLLRDVLLKTEIQYCRQCYNYVISLVWKGFARQRFQFNWAYPSFNQVTCVVFLSEVVYCTDHIWRFSKWKGRDLVQIRRKMRQLANCEPERSSLRGNAFARFKHQQTRGSDSALSRKSHFENKHTKMVQSGRTGISTFRIEVNHYVNRLSEQSLHRGGYIV